MTPFAHACADRSVSPAASQAQSLPLAGYALPGVCPASTHSARSWVNARRITGPRLRLLVIVVPSDTPARFCVA